jgi:hypothetical protein
MRVFGIRILSIAVFPSVPKKGEVMKLTKRRMHRMGKRKKTKKTKKAKSKKRKSY